MHHILVYGDSLSWGIIPGTRQRFEFAKRWPGAMERHLIEQGESVRVTEDCLNGRRTKWDDPDKAGRSGLAGLEQRIEINSPLSLVIIFLGTNDFQTVHNIDATESAGAIGDLISAIRQAPIEPGMPTPEILVVAPPRIKANTGSMATKFAGAETKCEGHANEIGKVARRLACHFFDANSVTEASKIDGVHLDEDQHCQLAAALAMKVQGILNAS